MPRLSSLLGYLGLVRCAIHHEINRSIMGLFQYASAGAKMLDCRASHAASRPYAAVHGADQRNILSRLAFKKRTAWGNPEKIMCRILYGAAVAAAFLGTVAVASAELNLTAQQKQTIMQSVQSERGQPAPAGFQPRVGTSVPQSMTMRALPSNIATEVPAAKGLEYTKLDNNEILLVDPKDRRVAEILMPSGTTGAAPSPMHPTPGAPR